MNGKEVVNLNPKDMAYLKYIIPGALILLSLLGYQVYRRGFFTFLSSTNLERVDASEASKLLSKGALTILDVRDENEFDVSHLAGAKRYEEGVLKGLDPKMPVLVYCTVGIRSNKLAQTLRDQGFSEIIELQDGLIGWSNAQLPLVNSMNKDTDSIHVYNQFFGKLLKEGVPVY